MMEILSGDLTHCKFQLLSHLCSSLFYISSSLSLYCTLPLHSILLSRSLSLSSPSLYLLSFFPSCPSISSCRSLSFFLLLFPLSFLLSSLCLTSLSCLPYLFYCSISLSLVLFFSFMVSFSPMYRPLSCSLAFSFSLSLASFPNLSPLILRLVVW